MDLEKWISKTGIQARTGGFQSPPPFPYIALFDRVSVGGDDFHNRIFRHFIKAELYNDDDKDDPRAEVAQSERKIESLLDGRGVHYEKIPATLIKSERMWVTTYEFELLEVR